MTVGTWVGNILNNKTTRGLLRGIIYMRYKQRGEKIEYVKYHPDLKVWEIRIDGTSLLSTGPGWVYTKEYLLEVIKRHSYLPAEGDVVVDVGAGVGEETIIFSTLVGDAGKVYSIEAHPKTNEALCYLVKTNHLQNVVTSSFALSDNSGTVEIEDTENSLANSILGVSSGAKTFLVKSETFDEFIERNNIQTVDLLKMNVEGAEQLIIKGMQRHIGRVKRVAISCHDFRFHQGESEFFKTKAIITEFLTRNNFNIYHQQSAINMVDDYVYGNRADQ